MEQTSLNAAIGVVVKLNDPSSDAVAISLWIRRRSAAFGEKRARQAPLSRTLRCGDQRPIDDVALRMAAADPGRVIADRQHRFDGAPVVVGRESEHAIDEAPANFG